MRGRFFYFRCWCAVFDFPMADAYTDIFFLRPQRQQILLWHLFRRHGREIEGLLFYYDRQHSMFAAGYFLCLAAWSLCTRSSDLWVSFSLRIELIPKTGSVFGFWATGHWAAVQVGELLFCGVTTIDQNGLAGHPPAFRHHETDPWHDIFNIRQARFREG